jgi:hypothetical protein
MVACKNAARRHATEEDCCWANSPILIEGMLLRNPVPILSCFGHSYSDSSVAAVEFAHLVGITPNERLKSEPLKAPLLDEKQIVNLSREFKQRPRVLLLGGLFAQWLPTFVIFSHTCLGGLKKLSGAGVTSVQYWTSGLRGDMLGAVYSPWVQGATRYISIQGRAPGECRRSNKLGKRGPGGLPQRSFTPSRSSPWALLLPRLAPRLEQT